MAGACDRLRARHSPRGRERHDRARRDALGRGPNHVGAPTEAFPKSPVTLYLTCDDPDAAYAKAKAAGGEITMELVDQPYGNREFAVRDPEGHTWSFGTYEPR